MSWIVKHLNDTTITIVGHREPHVCDPRVYYKILVKSGPRTWMVRLNLITSMYFGQFRNSIEFYSCALLHNLFSKTDEGVC